MLTRMILAPLGLAFALAACNQSPSVSLTNASPEEVAKASAAAGAGPSQQKPGNWETTAEVVSVEMPGVPEAEKKMMESVLKRPPVTTTSCLTEEQIKKPDPKMFAGSQANEKCRFSKYTIDNGKLDADMVCKTPQGDMTMKLTGQFAPETAQVQMVMDMKGPPGQGALKMTMKSSGRRTGDCPKK